MVYCIKDNIMFSHSPASHTISGPSSTHFVNRVRQLVMACKRGVFLLDC